MVRSTPSVSARFDPDPNHYLLTEVEFDRLCEVARIPEKENSFFLLGILIPCAITAFTSLPKSDPPSLSFLLNFIVVVVAALTFIFQARGWYSKRKVFREFVKDMKERPEGRLAMTPAKTQIFTPAQSPQK